MYWKIFCPKVGQVSNPERLTYTQILVKYPSPPWGQKLTPLWKPRSPWEVERPLELERLRDCDMPVHRWQRNNNWAREEKTGSHLFLQFRKVISPFHVLNTPQCLYGVKITILKINTRLRSESKFHWPFIEYFLQFLSHSNTVIFSRSPD